MELRITFRSEIVITGETLADCAKQWERNAPSFLCVWRNVSYCSEENQSVFLSQSYPI